MNYNIKGTEVAITPEIREYLEKKLTSLEKFVQHKENARVDVELQYLVGEAKMFRAEVMLIDPNMPATLRAEARGGALHEALDIAFGELSGELTRSKKRRLDNIRRGATKVKAFLRGWSN